MLAVVGFGRRVAHALMSVAVAIVLAGVAIVSHSSGLDQIAVAPVGAEAPADPALAMTTAATMLEASTAKGAPGYTFEILQRSTIHARPGGPQIEIPDPTDRHKSLGFADTYELGSLIERGAATPAGFAMEMRTGPVVGKPADWTSAYQFGVTTAGKTTYRNDGAGWYQTDDPPGIGLDPRTAALLPTLLRNATDVANKGFSTVGDVQLPTLIGAAKVGDIPGIVAVDGASFTELAGPLEFTLDAQGRLAQLHVVARNTNLDVYDLVVDTTITFGYPSAAADLPAPSPARPASADAVQK